MKKIFAFACLMLWSHCSFAQYNIEGTVTDTKNKPVFLATIALTKKDSSIVQVTKTDSLGHFTLRDIVENQYRLTVYAIGYAKKTIPVTFQKDQSVHIVLEPLAKNLREITVVGNKPLVEHKSDRIIFNTSGSISAKGSTGLDLLKKAPGVNISNKAISLAGKGSLGVMVDGQLLHLSGKALLNYLKSYSTAQISDIEIITNPSAKYDAEGNSGLINIVTKKKKPNGFSGMVTGSLKSFLYHNQPIYNDQKIYGAMNGSIGLNYKSKKWSLHAGSNYTSDRELQGYGIDVSYPQRYWAMGDTGKYSIANFNIRGRVDYKPNDKTTLGFEYNYYRRLIENGADHVHAHVFNNIGRLDSTLRTYADYHPIAHSNDFNIHLIQALESGGKLTLNADYFNWYRNDWSDLAARSYNRAGKLRRKNIRMLHDTTVQKIPIYTFKADVELPTSFAQLSLGSKLSFINNYSNIFYYDKTEGKLILDEDLSNEFRYIENTQAIYVNASREMKKWTFNVGLRAELTQTKAISYRQDQKLKKYYLKLFPSVSAKYKLNGNNRVSLTYDKRIHRPTFWDMNPYKSFMTAYTYVEGNPYLEPAYITNMQLSHQYKHLLTSSLYLNIVNNGFSRVIKTHDQGDYTHTATKLNFIRSRRYGISESLNIQPVWWLTSSDLVRGYYTNVRSDIAYIDGLDGLGLYMETKNTFYFSRNKTVNGFLGFWYQFPEIDHFGRTDSYYSLNLGVEWSPPQKRLSLSLNYNDLFQSSASINHTIVNGIQNTYTNFQLHSQIRLSVTWHFGKENSGQNSKATSNKTERSRVN